MARVSCAAAYSEAWLADLWGRREDSASDDPLAAIVGKDQPLRSRKQHNGACEQKGGGTKEESSSNADWIGERTDQ